MSDVDTPDPVGTPDPASATVTGTSAPASPMGAAPTAATSASTAPTILSDEGDGAARYDQVEEALRDVVDPELDVNIVDLGLIYDLSLYSDGSLVITMTLTTAACPLTDVLEEQIDDAMKGVVDSVRIEWVWSPPWSPERITDEGRDMMRALGFAM